MLFRKITEIETQIRQRVGLYGWRETLIRISKSIIYRCLKFRWEKCLLMSRPLGDLTSPPLDRGGWEVRELKMADYDHDLWKDFLTEEKRLIYEKRFRDKNCKAYGVFVNEILTCSTWILYGQVWYSEKIKLLEGEECALLLDDYCLPSFRGKGIHTYLNLWRLYEMQTRGVKKAYVIVLSFNRPAIRTQRKCGFDVEKKFYAYSVGNRTFVKTIL